MRYTGVLPYPPHFNSERLTPMDGKAKKRIQVLRKRIEKLQLQLSGAKQQNDEPGEVERIEAEIADVLAEIEKLKKS